MESINYSNILLNFKRITLPKKTIEYSFKYNKKLEPTKVLTKFLKDFNITPSLESINITQLGIFFNINPELKLILSRYNINPNTHDIEKELEKTITYLKNINNINQLKQYPYLYKQYQNKQIKLKKYIDIEIQKVLYLQKGYKSNFKYLTDCNIYNDLIDENKLKILTAHKIKELLNNKKYQKEALKYLKTFLETNKELLDNNYKVKIYTDDIYLTKITTYSIQELNNLIFKTKVKKAPTRANFIDITPTEEKHYEILKKYYKLGLSSKNEEERKQLLQRKIDFYKTLKIKKYKIGIDTFDGYIGFQLDNGLVLLDKFFENKQTGLIAHGQSIYITTEKEFEIINKQSKTDSINQIKDGKLLTKRYIHKGAWEEKIKKTLDKIN